VTRITGRFGDFFHEIPEPEIFPLPCGGFVSSECVINSLGLTYAVEVIPRKPMIKVLTGICPSHDIALGFRITEHAGTGEASIYLEPNGMVIQALLGWVFADSLPEIKQAA
jgi:hypothetical protein